MLLKSYKNIDFYKIGILKTCLDIAKSIKDSEDVVFEDDTREHIQNFTKQFKDMKLNFDDEPEDQKE